MEIFILNIFLKLFLINENLANNMYSNVSDHPYLIYLQMDIQGNGRNN